MMTIEPEPMNGPPSLRCQCGAGSFARSTLRPRMEFSRNGASVTVDGPMRRQASGACSIQAFSASSGVSDGSMPSASAARCGVVVALVKTRKPGAMALDAVEQQRRAFRRAGRDLGDAAELEARIGAVDATQRAELVHLLDESAQILVDHRTHPAITASRA